MKITSRKNPLVSEIRDLLKEKKLRDEKGMFAAEGVKLCEEALSAGIKPIRALISDTAEQKFPDIAEKLRAACETTLVSDEVYLYLSEQKSPQGILLAGEILDKSVNLDRILNSRKILVLDCVQDSGNVGTMLRTAEALGIGGVITGGECADIWSPKTLRASMGSVFRIPVYQADTEKAIAQLKNSGFEVYAAMLDEKAEKLGEFAFPEKAAVIIGNEGHGVSKTAAALCKKIYIPISGAESLNAAAAAAIICWELTKEK